MLLSISSYGQLFCCNFTEWTGRQLEYHLKLQIATFSLYEHDSNYKFTSCVIYSVIRV